MPSLSTAYLFSGGNFTQGWAEKKEKVEQILFFGFHRERLVFLSALVKVCP